MTMRATAASSANLLAAIGQTPLVRLSTEVPVPIYAKLEYLNPGGSLKDRAALYMVEEAERLGLLAEHGTIVEASSGNQGIALAMIGALKGYSVVICCPQRTSREKLATMRAYGAHVHVCPEMEELDHPEGYHALAARLAQEIPGAWRPNQYFNTANAAAHYQTTGPEIWSQTEGRVTHCVLGMGSCGSITGIGRYLKERNREIQIIGVDAANSFLSTSGHPQLYRAEGIGVDVLSDNLDLNVIDQVVPVQDEEAFASTRRLARCGYLVGISSGAVMHAALERAVGLNSDHLMVVLFADSGRAYLSKVFEEERRIATVEQHA